MAAAAAEVVLPNGGGFSSTRDLFWYCNVRCQELLEVLMIHSLDPPQQVWRHCSFGAWSEASSTDWAKWLLSADWKIGYWQLPRPWIFPPEIHSRWHGSSRDRNVWVPAPGQIVSSGETAEQACQWLSERHFPVGLHWDPGQPRELRSGPPSVVSNPPPKDFHPVRHSFRDLVNLAGSRSVQKCCPAVGHLWSDPFWWPPTAVQSHPPRPAGAWGQPKRPQMEINMRQVNVSRSVFQCLTFPQIKVPQNSLGYL